MRYRECSFPPAVSISSGIFPLSPRRGPPQPGTGISGRRPSSSSWQRRYCSPRARSTPAGLSSRPSGSVGMAAAVGAVPEPSPRWRRIQTAISTTRLHEGTCPARCASGKRSRGVDRSIPKDLEQAHQYHKACGLSAIPAQQAHTDPEIQQIGDRDQHQRQDAVGYDGGMDVPVMRARYASHMGRDARAWRTSRLVLRPV